MEVGSFGAFLLSLDLLGLCKYCAFKIYCSFLSDNDFLTIWVSFLKVRFYFSYYWHQFHPLWSSPCSRIWVSLGTIPLSTLEPPLTTARG